MKRLLQEFPIEAAGARKMWRKHALRRHAEQAEQVTLFACTGSLDCCRGCSTRADTFCLDWRFSLTSSANFEAKDASLLRRMTLLILLLSIRNVFLEPYLYTIVVGHSSLVQAVP